MAETDHHKHCDGVHTLIDGCNRNNAPQEDKSWPPSSIESKTPTVVEGK